MLARNNDLGARNPEWTSRIASSRQLLEETGVIWSSSRVPGEAAEPGNYGGISGLRDSCFLHFAYIG